MRTAIAAIFIISVLVLTGPLFGSSGSSLTGLPEECRCASPDGSCFVRISCQGGCIQHCVGQGDCYAECSSDSQSLLAPRTTNSPAADKISFLRDYLDTELNIPRTTLTEPFRTVHSFTDSNSTCSCEKASGRACSGEIHCSNGCTAAAGSEDRCFLSCRGDVFASRITETFNKKTGVEIAAALSSRLSLRIEFVPSRRNRRERFDVQIKDDDGWNVLNFLYKQGAVKINGVEFSRIHALVNQTKKGGRISSTPRMFSLNSITGETQQ